MKLFSKIHLFSLALICCAAALIGTSDTLCADLQQYTYQVPIDSNVKVYFNDNDIFIPTASGEFRVYLDRYAQWGFSYSNDIHEVLPEFMFADGIRPVSIEFGMEIDVSWDSGFSSGTNLNLDPSFKFSANTTNVRVNSQYPGGYEMVPYTVNYIQDGRDYGSTWERNLRNAPYIFKFKYSTETPVDSYDGGFGAWIATFQYGNVAGDDVNGSGYGLVFTVKNFYFTFTYLDDSVQESLDDINSALNDDSFTDDGLTTDLEDFGSALTPPEMPSDLGVDNFFLFMDDALLLASRELSGLYSSFYQPINVTIYGQTFNLMDIFISVLVFLLIGSLLFLVLKGGHGGGSSRGDDSA